MGFPSGVEQFVADADLTHGGPSGGCGERGVEGESLADAGTGGDDDHLSRVQSVGEFVEFGEPRGHADRDAAAAGDRVDLVHRRLQQFFEGDEVFGGAPFGDIEDLGLRTVDDFCDVLTVRAGVAVLDDARACFDEPAQDGLLRDDLGVVAGVRGSGHRLGQGDEVRGAADALELAAAVEFGRHGDGVGGFAAAVEVEDRVVDGLVGGAVEIAGAQHLENVGDGVLAQQHAADDGLLGNHVLRGLATEVTT